MKKILLIAITLFVCSVSFSQTIKKSWIVTQIENLSDQHVNTEQKYERYDFTSNDAYVSFYPGWYGTNVEWSLTDKYLKLGFETYLLETLTDSTLIFSKDGFRRFKLISEEAYSRVKPKPDTTLTLNGRSVYIANDYYTPRLKKQYKISELIKMSDYNIKTEIIFLAKFVVTEKGKIDRIEIVNGINEGFDQEFKKLMLQTSGKWTPLVLNNKPVNSQLTYTIHYLASFTDRY
jgi:hypothetical protein